MTFVKRRRIINQRKKANPEKYIDYENEVKTDTERIDTLEATTDDIILMMADLIGGEA